MVPLAELESPADNHIAALGEIAAELIHEIRNPLAAIQGHLELWRGQCAAGRVPDPSGFPIVIEEVASINRLLNNFLTFTKYARKSVGTCDVADVVRHAILLLEPEAAKWGVRTDLRIRREPLVEANPYFLGRVFINLMRNAFAATPVGGRLVIAIDERPTAGGLSPVGDRGGAAPETFAVIEFRDNGQGFTPDQLGALEQTGIGLAFCREVLRGYRGTMAVESSPAGTCVTVALPSVPEVRG